VIEIAAPKMSSRIGGAVERLRVRLLRYFTRAEWTDFLGGRSYRNVCPCVTRFGEKRKGPPRRALQ
jgi:hypothetical protein